VLMGKPDMLILDEPTNHLDIWMIEWLENYLTRQKTTLLMVTHDRYFLDNVCNRIIEIDRGQAYSYQGNYDYYLQKREERMENMSAELAKVKNLLRTEREWMRRQPQARGSKAKYRIDNFHQLEEKSRVDLRSRDVAINVKSSYIGSKIFEARDVKKSFGDKKILNGWSYDFARYEKVGIVGDNGAGKSTFIKLLLGELQPDSGSFDIGETVRWGYYSQEGMTGFDERKKVIDAVREIAEVVRIDDKTTLTASAFLSQFLFTPQTQQKYIAKLSGGERRRLYLATVLMRNPNFLILDEPTNDLDIMTLAVLEDYLVNFKGCVIIVSHDRFFLDRIV
ncbi:MAG: ATP-binding cassette domain-containing protein, partial [Muribaculaceae bacterium]|nr:ATP-binding cassette domain-containing protein [Muribaculaceae bacterium]